jgi:hypothetical protein
MHTAVALIVFNRPELTAQVFAEIAKAKPPKLLVIADGPRPDHPEDAGMCAAAAAVLDQVDWDCEVLKNYSKVNLGVARRMATGITWVFDQVEEAIILEDDCVPDPTFFRFCDELLEKYRQDERVMAIAGNDFQFGQKSMTSSYFFSYYNVIWGWATWRRAWRHFDFTLRLWPMLRNTSWLSEIVRDIRAAEYWKQMFDGAYAFAGLRPTDQGHELPYELRDGRKLAELFDSLRRLGLIRPTQGGASAWPGEFSTWDYQWSFACWAQNGLTIMPTTNLVSNVGFGPDATHTRCSPQQDKRACLPTEPMVFPLRHPPVVVPDREADRQLFEVCTLASLPKPLNLSQRLYQKCSSFIQRHPSLKSPRLFARRLAQKYFATSSGVKI